MFYDDLMERLTAATPVLFLLLAGLIAHWLAIVRERRKEWLACCDELRPILMRERDSIGPYGGPTDVHWDKLLRRAGTWEAFRLNRAIAQYKRSREHTRQDELGQEFYSNPQAVRAAVNKLLALIR